MSPPTAASHLHLVLCRPVCDVPLSGREKETGSYMKNAWTAASYLVLIEGKLYCVAQLQLKKDGGVDTGGFGLSETLI